MPRCSLFWVVSAPWNKNKSYSFNFSCLGFIFQILHFWWSFRRFDQIIWSLQNIVANPDQVISTTLKCQNNCSPYLFLCIMVLNNSENDYFTDKNGILHKVLQRTQDSVVLWDNILPLVLFLGCCVRTVVF